MNIIRFTTKFLVNGLKRYESDIICIKNNKFHNAIINRISQLKDQKLYQVKSIQEESKRFLNQSPKNFRQLPDLIYVPHVLRWLKTKIKFKYLRRKWDPEFSEGAFIFGSTHAVCRITEIIHDNKPDELDELVTVSTKAKIAYDISGRLSKKQRKIIKLKPDDIKILVPISVSFETGPYDKLCRIRLRVLALKWYDSEGGSRLVLVALQTEFLRNYLEGAKPEWTISDFDILECSLLTESPQPPNH